MFASIEILNPNILYLLRDDLQEAGEKFRDNGRLRRLFEEIRDEVVIPSIQKNFDVGGRPRWENLSQVTLMRRGMTGGEALALQLAGATSPLVNTGRMKRSAVAKARFTIRDNQMTYGNWPLSRWWAPVHNFGGQGGHIPQRQFVGLQQEDITAIREITNEWIEENIDSSLQHRYI